MAVYCIHCGDEVSGRRHALQCDGCSRWQHRLCGNTGVDHKLYKEMTKKQRDGTVLTWFCSDCKHREVTQELIIPTPSVDEEDVESFVEMVNRETDMDITEAKYEQRANSVELQQLGRYIRSTWMKNPMWSPRTWTVYQQNVRTNNDVEGWHTRLISKAGRANLTFYLLVPLLRREGDLVDVTQRLVSEEQLREHRSKYQKVQGKLHDLWAKYDSGDISASQLLKECAKFYGPTND